MRTRKKLVSNVLSIALSFAMVVTSLFVMPANASAAAKASITNVKRVESDTTRTYTIKNLSKTQFAKISVSGTARAGVTVKKDSALVKSSTKIMGTGKKVTLNVTNANVAGLSYSLKMKVYSKKSGKLLFSKTSGPAFVYRNATEMTMNATLSLTVGSTAVLTPSFTPADATNTVSYTSSNPSVATVDNGTVTAVAAGTATITATSDNGLSSTCTVTVSNKLEARQSARNEITVSGATSTLISDYVVKKGSAIINIAKATSVNGAIVLTASTSYLATGDDYTLTYKGETIKFTVAEPVISKIEFVSDTMIKEDATVTASSRAYFAFRTLDQFGNDIKATVIVSSSAGSQQVATTGTAAKVTLTIGALAIGYKFPVSIVESTRGVNASQTLTVSSPSKAAKAEFIGLYNTSTKKAVTLGNSQKLSNIAMLFRFTDQYGVELTTAPGSDVIFTPSAGATGITVGKATTAVIDSKTYIALPLNGTALTGTFIMTIVQNSTGVIGTANFSVGEGVYVKTLEVYASSTIYMGQENQLSFAALDGNGVAITDPTVLNSLITCSQAKFVADKNGLAKLVYTPSAEGVQILVFVANPTTARILTKTVTVSVSGKRVPTTIIGLDKGIATAITAHVGNHLTITGEDLQIADQYGSLMTDSEVATSGYRFTTAVTNSSTDVTVAPVTVPTLLTKTGTIAALTSSGKIGSSLVTISLNDGKKTVANSDYALTLQIVDIESISSFTFGAIGLCYHKTVAVNPVRVYGVYGGMTIALDTEEYTIVKADGTISGTTLTAPEITETTTTTKTGTIVAVIDNKSATEVTTTYQYSNAARAAAKLESDTTALTTSGAGSISMDDLIGTVKAVDQYGASYSLNASNTRFKLAFVTGSDSAIISFNNTGKVSVTLPAGTYVVNVTTTVGIQTLTQQLTITVK